MTTPRPPIRLSTRLGISSGVLVVLLLASLVLAQQGLFRMVGLITQIRDEQLSAVDAEEELHRVAWRLEVVLRHGATSCAQGSAAEEVRARVQAARFTLVEVLARYGQRAEGLLHRTAQRYVGLADAALVGEVCERLTSEEVSRLRLQLDEDLTDVWIARLRVVHTRVEELEDAARRIGIFTTVTSGAMALLVTLAAVLIARATARSVTRPIASLASAATRLGAGDFAPIAPVRGPLEVEELWRELERAREGLLALEQVKQRFLASVSHELRTPLAKVREAIALLADGACGPVSAEQGKVLGMARRACDREVQIVNGLLDLTRLQLGLSLVRQAACDIDRVLETAIESERPEAIERGVQIALDVPGRAPSLSLDASLVERAIANLIRNAVSVTPLGGTVRVRRELTSNTPSTALRVEVRDQGPGMVPDARARLFQPFSSAAVPTASRQAGLGLGLSLARDVALAHGGELALAETGPNGTVFQLTLPLTAPEP